MTAEIAILNKEAVALASDSAVTIRLSGGQKIFTSANKLFPLSNYEPVGIMVYNSAHFMGVPWEVIVKLYRDKLGEKRFNTLEDYFSDFILFLEKGNPLFPLEVQKDFLRNYVSGYFTIIVKDIVKEVQSTINNKGSISDKEIEDLVASRVATHSKPWQKEKVKCSISTRKSRSIIKRYAQIIEEQVKAIFKQLPITQDTLDKLMNIAVNLYVKGTDREGNSGVVIAGFGDKDYFPAIKQMVIDGIIDSKLKYMEELSSRISRSRRGLISPFAQREMVARFMEGIDPNYKEIEEGYIAELCKQFASKVSDNMPGFSDKQKIRLKRQLHKIGVALSEDFISKRENLVRQKFVNPITMVVSFLPKNELASMAEALVHLTSLKRRFTMEAETVAEPIDVAIISKGEGFIWIRKKQYFPAELNPQYVAKQRKG